jgi:MFS superfamily sulfate permease-like transporter
MRAWIDMTLMGLTFILTIIWSVQVGVTVSLIISLLLVVRRSSKTRMTILVRRFFDKNKFDLTETEHV